MAKVTFKGKPVQTSGDLPKTGTKAPDFKMVKGDLSELKLSDLKGKRVVLNIFPSLDTSVCATSVRKFNEMASKLGNTVILAISKDLPFAQSRFCTTEGIDRVIALSDFRDADFNKHYGVLMTEGPLAGLLARAVVVIDENGKIIYEELVPEIAQEPDYQKALTLLS